MFLNLTLRTSSPIFDLVGKFSKLKSEKRIPRGSTVSGNEKCRLYNILSHIEQQPCTRHCADGFPSIGSFNPHNNPVGWDSGIPIFQGGN